MNNGQNKSYERFHLVRHTVPSPGGRSTGRRAQTGSIQHETRHGFSLIEVMIVVALLGVLTAIALPLLNSRDRKFNNFVMDAYELITLARATALVEGRMVIVSVEADRLRAFLDNDADGVFTPAGDMEVQSLAFPKDMAVACTLNCTAEPLVSLAFDSRGFGYDSIGSKLTGFDLVLTDQPGKQSRHLEIAAGGGIRTRKSQ